MIIAVRVAGLLCCWLWVRYWLLCCWLLVRCREMPDTRERATRSRSAQQPATQQHNNHSLPPPASSARSRCLLPFFLRATHAVGKCLPLAEHVHEAARRQREELEQRQRVVEWLAVD